MTDAPSDSGLPDAVPSGGAAGTGGAAGSGGSAGSTGGAPPADASDAPADAQPGACQCDDPGCGTCPTTKMVAAGGYGIEPTEVTNQAYAAWLATVPDPKLQVGACAWNTSYTPSQAWPATAPNAPVVYVDWCDAAAYCDWAKQRLCGKIGGGSSAYADFTNPTQSQWQNACSAGGSKTYPYGATYSSTACNGADSGKGAAIDVGSATGCEGGYPELYDMSGNVWEWEDSCSATTGESDLCRIRGGSYSQSSTALGCNADSSLGRNTAGKSVGFRCCE